MPTTEIGVLQASVFTPKSGPANIVTLEPELTVNAGSTTHFNVSYDSSLGTQGATDANSVLARCEADYNSMEYYFSGITPGSLPFNIGINTGSRGASHATCASTGISIGANSGPATDTAFINLLVGSRGGRSFHGRFWPRLELCRKQW